MGSAVNFSVLRYEVANRVARIARQATGAIARIKGCVNAGIYEGIARGLAEERRAVVENFESPDVREGVDAFLAGRKPRFQG
jgi:enoyl-CoA hydratase/carnithine racemase